MGKKLREEGLLETTFRKSVKKIKISNPSNLLVTLKFLLKGGAAIFFLNFHFTDILCKAVKSLLLRLMRTNAISARIKIMIDAFAVRLQIME